MPPDSGGICIGVDWRNLRFSPGLPPGWCMDEGLGAYSGTSLIRNSAPLGPYRGPMPRALWWFLGGVLFLMSEVPLCVWTRGCGLKSPQGCGLTWTHVGGGVRIHPENARMSGRHGVQYVAQCVACAALTLVVCQ